MVVVGVRCRSNHQVMVPAMGNRMQRNSERLQQALSAENVMGCTRGNHSAGEQHRLVASKRFSNVVRRGDDRSPTPKFFLHDF